MSAHSDFTQRLFSRVLGDSHQNLPGVQDDWGMARPLSTRRRVGDAVESAAARMRMSRRHFEPDEAGARLAAIASLSKELARTDSLLADQASRDLLLDVISTRVLGEHHARLPVSQADFRAACARIDEEMREERDVDASEGGGSLHRYAIPGRRGTVTLIGVAFLVHEFFGAEQYALRRPGVEIAPERGDVVIDGGGGWGETALYFADAVGAGGLVLSFEFVADNLRLFERNMALNPHLRDRVRLVAHPIWSAPGVDLAYAPAGGQTSVAAPAGDTEEARTESIDHACAEHGIDHVDFLKLDVEGAEMEALRGAEQTIRRARPKLALSVYHRDEDLARIPAWVQDLGIGYRLFMDHSWPGPAETVLFAQPT